jgi:hypothetical protein
VSTIKVDTYLTRGGASEIAIDKLKGASSAASISVVAEGGTNTTNLQQGLAKAWVVEDHKTSNEIKDSLNVASITDIGTGVSKFFYTNNMAGSEYAALSGMSSGVYNGACNMPSFEGGDDGWSMATTYWHHSTRGNGTTMTLADSERVVSGILGDLA